MSDTDMTSDPGRQAPPPASGGNPRLRRRLKAVGGVALSLALTLLGLLVVTFVIGRLMPKRCGKWS